MNKKYFFVLFVPMVVLLSMGVGCDNQDNGAMPDERENESVAEYDSVTELSSSDSGYKNEHAIIKNVFERVFGGAKLTAIVEVFESIDIEGSETSEYTTERSIAFEDLDSLLRSFKEKGFVTEFNVEEETSVSFGVSDSIIEIVGYYEVGNQTVTIQISQAVEVE